MAQRFGRVGGRVAPQRQAVAPDQEFGEIPFDGAGAQQAGLACLQPAVQRVGVGAVDVDLGEQREADGVLGFAELRDGGLVARLLAPELVARKSQDDKAFVAVRAVQFFQARVLGREPAARGDIDHQRHLAAKIGQRAFRARYGGGAEVVHGVHAGSPGGRFRPQRPAWPV
ncbi:Uncharacterised protein [Bordetella pertussis]|nr:Uncharacterised protein [Bordetella pertussis]